MKKQTTRVLAQGKLSSQLSPAKETPAMKGIRKDHVNPLCHVQSTPAHNTERGGILAPPPLNWDLSMVQDTLPHQCGPAAPLSMHPSPPIPPLLGISNDQSSMENRSGDKTADTSEETNKKTKRKIVPIKSRFMQSAASRATPKNSAKKPAPVTGRSSFYTPATGTKDKMSDRAKAIEKEPSEITSSADIVRFHQRHTITSFTSQSSTKTNRLTDRDTTLLTQWVDKQSVTLNHEDTFTTLPEKPCTPKATKAKVAQSPIVASPSLRNRPETPKKHAESPKVNTKPPKPLAERKVGSGTPKLGRKVIQSSQKSNVSSDVTPPHANGDTGALQEVTQTHLNVMYHQKLQIMYLVSRMRETKGKMGEEASKQLYQMWKVQENLRSEKAELDKNVCLKLYITETADMVDVLLPLCSELGTALPTFERQFRSMAQMLDSTRHYIDTQQIAALSPEHVGELEAALRKCVRLLQAVNDQAGDDKENLKSYALNLQQLCDTINKVTSHFAKSSSYIKTIFSDLKYQTYLTSVMDSMNRGNKSFI